MQATHVEVIRSPFLSIPKGTYTYSLFDSLILLERAKIKQSSAPVKDIVVNILFGDAGEFECCLKIHPTKYCNIEDYFGNLYIKLLEDRNTERAYPEDEMLLDFITSIKWTTH